MKNLKRFLLFSLAIALLTATANAAVMTFFRPGGGDIHMDVYVRGGAAFADVNQSGDIVRNFIGPIDNEGTPARTYFGFDISALPADTEIESVKLTLLAYESDSSSGTDPVTYDLHSTTSFVETEITFNDCPAMGSLLSSLIAVPGTVVKDDEFVYNTSAAFVTAAQAAFGADGMFYIAAKAEDDTGGGQGGDRNLLRTYTNENVHGALPETRPCLTITFTSPAFRPGDADESGAVDALDAAILAANWLSSDNVGWGEGDFNDDGVVDDIDATMMAANWGTASAAVPEPSTAALLLAMSLGIAVLLRRKRR